MKIMTRIVLVATATAFAASTALADGHMDKYVEIMATVSSHDRERLIDDGFAGGSARAGFAFNERWNFEGALSVLDLDPDEQKGGTAGLEQISLGINALAVYNRDGSFQPFFLLGAGAVESEFEGSDDDTSLYYDIGVGAFVPVGDNGRIRAEVVRRTEDDEFTSRDYIANLGFGFGFGKKSAPVAVAAAPLDSDGDGVTDDLDQCPDTPAGASVDANGCELDSDGDGVVDSKDKCPGTPAGKAVDADGCALVSVINLEGVNFRTNSAYLLDGASGVLDEQAATLVANPGVSIEVAGHTDSDGDAGYNQQLSQRRAEAVRNYLVGKDVAGDRIAAVGYGEAEPIASNDTRDGKAQNRRVELRITNN